MTGVKINMLICNKIMLRFSVYFIKNAENKIIVLIKYKLKQINWKTKNIVSFLYYNVSKAGFKSCALMPSVFLSMLNSLWRHLEAKSGKHGKQFSEQ